nr:MAG TPA: nucelotide kinase [Caudoviricetes sp.]
MGIKILEVQAKKGMTVEDISKAVDDILNKFQKEELDLENSDNIDNPQHYKLNGLDIESIDVVRSVLGKEKFIGFCKGNILKYLIREENKNGLEDVKKAKKYMDWLTKEMEG